MKSKKALAVICMIGLSCSLLTGCKQSKKETTASSYSETIDFESVVESARQQGYNQAYLELYCGFHSGVSEESYSRYLEAKQQYEEDMTLEHFNDLTVATQVALEEVQNAKN